VSTPLRLAISPRWLGGHLLVLAVAVTMVLLGRWQWDKHGGVINYGYACQWWLFTVFGFLFWGRVLRDAARRYSGAAESEPVVEEPAPVQYRRYVAPTVEPEPVDDPELSAYNRYLATLSKDDA
jgi:DNA-binding transcriptional regulator of glucitol operon